MPRMTKRRGSTLEVTVVFMEICQSKGD
jgi:hypothetical protein